MEAGDDAKFNVTLAYPKNAAVKGKFTYTFERTEAGARKKYEITAATVSSLAILPTALGGTASITGTGTLRDVTTDTPQIHSDR